MTLNEKAAYLKGLAEGMKLNDSNPADKLTLSMIDLLKDVADTLTNIDGDLDLAFDELEELRDELDDGFEDDEDDEDGDEDLYELECPKCGEKVYFDFDEIESGESACPACGEHLEIELGEEDDEDDECTCGYCCEEADEDDEE